MEEQYNFKKNNSEQRYNFTILDNEIFFDKRLNVYQKNLLWFFNIVSINKDYSNYSIKKIALMSGMSEATIKRSIPELIELGYIKKSQKKLPNGFYQNYYFLCDIKKTSFTELIRNHTGSDRAIGSDSTTIQGLTDTVYRVYESHYTGSDRATNNINNNINKEYEENNIHVPSFESNEVYDVDTNTYMSIDKQTEWKDFLVLFFKAYEKLAGRTTTSLDNITGYALSSKNAKQNRYDLFSAFSDRVIDYKKAMSIAYEITNKQKIGLEAFWDFRDKLLPILKNGYKQDNTSNETPKDPRDYSYYEQEGKEREAKREAELQARAKKEGKTLEEIKELEAQEEQQEIDSIKAMFIQNDIGVMDTKTENSKLTTKELVNKYMYDKGKKNG